MRTFVNCLKFKIAPILFSVFLAFSLPLTSLRVEAASLTLPTTQFLSSLYSFLLSNQLISDGINNPFSSTSVTEEDIENAFVIFEELNSFRDGLGDEVKSAIIAGTLSGDVILDEQTRADFLTFVASNEGLINVCTTDIVYPLNPAGSEATFSFSYHNNSNPSIVTDTFTVTASSPFFIAEVPYTLSDRYYKYYYIVTTTGGRVSVTPSYHSTTFVATSTSTDRIRFDTSYGSQVIGYVTSIRCENWYNGNPYFLYDHIGTFATHSLPTRQFTEAEFADIFYNMMHSGVAGLDLDVTASLASSDTDVISKSNTIDSDGTVEGSFSFPTVSLEVLEKLLSSINSGVLSLKDALSVLSLGQVASDASVEEKQQALNLVLDLSPTLDLDYGSTTVDEATEAFSGVQTQEQTLTEEIEEKIRQGYDEDSSGKVDWWPQWSFPDYVDGSPGGLITDPDPDPSDTARITEIVSATGVIGGLLSDFFNASGGASGFGLIYIVGISFVLFSVLIGASHFLGALGGNDVRSSSRSSQRSVQRNSSVGKHERSHG